MKNLFKARWMTSLIFLIALFIITGIAAPGFLTYDNIVTCFNTATMYTLLAVGIAFVIMTGEIDVSIGAVIMSSIGRLLVFIGLPSTYNNTITGTMLIVIVVIDALAQRRSIEMTRRKRLLSRTADQEGGAKA